MDLTITQAAKNYGVSPATIRFWIKNGKLPAEKKVATGKKMATYQFRKSDFERLIKNDSTQPPAARPQPSYHSQIGQRVFDFVQKHPARFESMTLGEINELIKELES